MSSTSIGFIVTAAACALLPQPTHSAEPARPDSAAPVVIALAAPKDFASAVQVVEQATGAKSEKLRAGNVPLEDGRSFAVQPSVAQRLLEGSHAAFRKAGFYLFRYERSFGVGGEKDQLGLLRTGDRNVVIRQIGTAGAHGLTSEKIVAWLDVLGTEEPFELWEIGVDYVAGRFERAPKDPTAMARRCADFAPDLVAGRASTLDVLAAEIKANRTLYLMW